MALSLLTFGFLGIVSGDLDLLVIPLYGALSNDIQSKCFQPVSASESFVIVVSVY